MKVEIIEKKPCFMLRTDKGLTPYVSFHDQDPFVIYFTESLDKRIRIELSQEERVDLKRWIMT